MREPQPTSLFENIIAELRRIGLDPDELGGLAVGEGDADLFLAHLRSLSPGAPWSAAFQGAPDGWRPNAPAPERSLGPFDYAEPPRGRAVFASVMPGEPIQLATDALARVATLGIPIFGSEVVLDRGSPHLYVVFTHAASKDDVESVADFLRAQPGIANSYPVR
jgi:hypothetical protein